MSVGGIGPAVRALRYWERRQEVMSNNLANVDTTGFKRERVFARLLADGGPEAVAQDDFTAGALSETGRPLDIGMEGDGFLVVQTPDGVRYQRGGSLHLDDTGALVNEEGDAVLGDSGPIVLPPGKVAVDTDGTVGVDGAAVGHLRVERPSVSPRRASNGLWMPQGPGKRVPRDEIRVRQGHLEESNVDPVSSMVDMIEIQRAYGAVMRSVQTSDAVMHTVTSEIGRVSG